MAKTIAVSTPKPSSNLAYFGLTGLWIVSIILSFQVKNSAVIEKYKLSLDQLHLLQLILSVPMLLIWLAVLFAGLSIRGYANAISETKEGLGYRQLGNGLLVLLAGMIVGNFLNVAETLVSQNAVDPVQVKTNFIVLNNYVSVIAALAAYGLLFSGAQALLQTIGKHQSFRMRLMPLLPPFLVLSAVYILMIHANPNHQVTMDQTVNPTFGLPFWLIVLTVAIPFIISWLLGIMALASLRQYRAVTHGIIYKLFFQKLALGITIFIGLTIGLQLLAQLSNQLAESSLSIILLLITIIYVVIIYASLLMAQGSRQLKKIETLIAR